MASEVSICSAASVMLGGKPISDLAEGSDRARAAATLFEPVRNYVLRRHPWKCATKRIVLAPDADSPLFDWSYQFTLPDDYLRALSVGEDGGECDYEVESGKLLANSPAVMLRYIWRNTNPATWDDMLVWGMTMSMKAVLAYPITQSTSLEQLIEAVLRDVLKQARATDGQENPPQSLGDYPLLTSRFSNGSPFGGRNILSGGPVAPTPLVPTPDTSGGIVYAGGSL